MKPSLKIPRDWWGKIIGAALGLFRGGISGAIIGGLIGHLVDRFLSGQKHLGRTREVFFKPLFSTLGHLARADGRVTQAEIDNAEKLMEHLKLHGGERNQAIRYFNAGKKPDFRLGATLREFNRHTVMRSDLRLMMMELLVDLACADDSLTPPEQQVLTRTATLLRIRPDVFGAMLRARQAGAGRRERQWSAHQGGGAPVQPQGLSLGQAYATLGIDENAPDAEVKRSYRRLVSRYHPDKLVSQGLPDEMMEMAKTRVRDINKAYDNIKQSRGFK